MYRDKQFVADFLAKHILGKVVPDEIASRIDLTGLQPGPTEHMDPKMRTARFADLVWRAPFGDSWFYVVFLFEFEATPKWRMPVRILVETALAYDYVSKDTEASKERKLPPVLPIVVDVGGGRGRRRRGSRSCWRRRRRGSCRLRWGTSSCWCRRRRRRGPPSGSPHSPERSIKSSILSLIASAYSRCPRTSR